MITDTVRLFRSSLSKLLSYHVNRNPLSQPINNLYQKTLFERFFWYKSLTLYIGFQHLIY